MGDEERKVLVEVPGEVWQRARAMAMGEGRPVKALVTEALRRYCAAPSPVSPSELPSGPVRVTPTKAALVTAVERVAPGTVVGATAAPRCRRCGHGQAQHQPACRWMGCVCARFLETAAVTG
jgi:hypothetical protein